MMAEAKAQADGGSTTDADAIKAYYAVRKRALPHEETHLHHDGYGLAGTFLGAC